MSGGLWRQTSLDPFGLPIDFSGSFTLPKVSVDPRSLVNHMVPLHQSCWSLVTIEKYPRNGQALITWLTPIEAGAEVFCRCNTGTGQMATVDNHCNYWASSGGRTWNGQFCTDCGMEGHGDSLQKSLWATIKRNFNLTLWVEVWPLKRYIDRLFADVIKIRWVQKDVEWTPI